MGLEVLESYYHYYYLNLKTRQRRFASEQFYLSRSEKVNRQTVTQLLIKRVAMFRILITSVILLMSTISSSVNEENPKV